MNEGKRMFSIFAARMFEARVLEAYREKVSQERQKELLRELEEEKEANKQKEEKKAKENQKKKDKKRYRNKARFKEDPCRDDCRLQKLAKEEEKAAKAAERAAEEAALKEKQRKQEEEQKRRKEEDKLKREAARKAAEEEKQRRDEERRKRLAEEKEIQVDRERRRKEKEDRQKAERKDREEKERRAKEEKEARLAAEKAKKEQQEKDERERKAAKEREEKEAKEREAKEREVKEREARERAAKDQQTRTQATRTRPPPSPRANATASGSQRVPQASITPKKILSKQSSQPPPSSSTPAPSVHQPRQQSRPIVPIQASASAPQVQSPPQVSASPISTNMPPSTPTFPQGVSHIQHPVPSPRASFPPAQGVSPFGAYIPQMPVGLGSSALPRTFGAGLSFDQGFGRGLGAPAPIGPPKMGGISASVTSPAIAPGSAIQPPRRMSAAADPGPITRPIAPIARPAANGDISGSSSNSGNASPIRRSPSPKGVLGSSALAADDDEVVTNPSRRMAPGTVGHSWHSPQNSMSAPTPWRNAAPSQGFSPSRSNAIGGAMNLNMGLWGQPMGGPANVAPGSAGAGLNDWHPPHPGSHFYGGPPFMHPNHSTVTPPPHASGP
jgi:hypothetical protein